MDRPEPVPASLYDRGYYLTDNEGHREFAAGLNGHMHDKFRLALSLVEVKPGESVLDIGCGRGELLYYCAKLGARATGVDYSDAAVTLAREAIGRLPAGIQGRARALNVEVESYDFQETFDHIFMIEVIEHMRDWQLRALFEKVKTILKPGGTMIITSPNHLYEEYFRPVKMRVYLPLRFLKYLGRLARGKYRPDSVRAFFRDACKVRVDRGERNRLMHCNINSVSRLRALLKDFDAKIYCLDHSRDILTLIFRRWLGRQIVAEVRQRPASCRTGKV